MIKCGCGENITGKENNSFHVFTPDEAIKTNKLNTQAWSYIVGAAGLAGGFYIQMGKWTALAWGSGSVVLATNFGPSTIHLGDIKQVTTQRHSSHIAVKVKWWNSKGELLREGNVFEKCE